MIAEDEGTTAINRPIGRIGVLIPEGNIICETEFPSIAPIGYSFHYQRLLREGKMLNESSLLSMQYHVDSAASALSTISPTVLLYACTSGTFLSGYKRHSAMAERMQELSGIMSITTSTAVLIALRGLATKRIVMLTPYPAGIEKVEADFLRHYDVEVIYSDSFNCKDGDEIRMLSAKQVFDRALDYRGHKGQADAVFISCTNLPSFPIIERLENMLDMPVLTSNSASVWASLRLAGFKDDIAGIGAIGKMNFEQQGQEGIL